ncbi:unnamed protein product [Sphagnum jensenii]|uniref:non-specific serine/threonine protein kinase n=1 Tax=Sphagnum jensenii TaxID=128206 RepID=A0ABP1B9C5_9BRYO
MFGVSLGATLYSTVNLALKDPWVEEIIYNATDSRTFCLVAMVEAPVISLLELRPLPSGSYRRADPSYGGTMLRKVYRINCGSRPSESVRYPQDVSDRIWDPDQFYHPPGLTSTLAGTMSLKTSDVFDSAPMLVLTTDRFNFVNQSLLYALPLVADHVQLSGGFYLMNAFFAELNNEIGPSFSISVNGVLLLSAFPLTPLVAFEFTVLQAAGLWWNLSLGQVHGSPQINGLELLQLVTVHTPAFQDDGYNLQELQLDWVLGSDPCWPVPWMGVTCSDSGMVTSLDLSNLGLSGSIQSTFSDLANLQMLNLSYNNLRGEIPDFSHLQNLQTLDLRNNMLSGTLDQLTCLSSLQFLYVMNNQLSGPIPNVFHRSGFFINTSGNTCIGYGLGSCPVVSPRPSPSSSTVGSSGGGGSSSSISTSNIVNKSSRNFSLASILGGGISALLMVLALLAVILLGVHHRRKTLELIAASKEVDTKSADTDVRHRNAKQFSLKELDLATNHFKDLLGQGRFGPVYHGRLADGIQVAIKVKCVASNHGAESFANEVISLSRVRHQNLVRLLGFCYESKKQLLVYEFMPGGTLMDRLYGSTHQLHPLSWKERLLVAIGAAAGIEHLHYVSNPKIIHGDIKSSNILLGPQNITKVSDFGLSRLLAEGGKARPQTSVKGTAGYLDPEYFDTQQLTEKSDVFSFGVVLLEILCGREPLSSNYPPEAYNLLAWVRPVLQKGIQNGDYSMLDKTIENQFNPKSLEIVASIAVQCTEREGANRPTMLEVVKELRHSIINQEVFFHHRSSRSTNRGQLSFSFQDSGSPFLFSRSLSIQGKLSSSV